MATMIKRRPQSKKPPHHMPTHRLSLGSERLKETETRDVIFSFAFSFLKVKSLTYIDYTSREKVHVK
jgi:hypothetical protein